MQVILCYTTVRLADYLTGNVVISVWVIVIQNSTPFLFTSSPIIFNERNIETGDVIPQQGAAKTLNWKPFRLQGMLQFTYPH
jgi:hypothetical protein